jgi:aminoglycoside phosphotransferase (APT) family kinase protein
MDDIDGPRLLHGDLWNQNIMVADGAPEPTITGVCDGDRDWWGDPASDWPIFMALRRPGSERDALWDGYGQLRSDPEATWRSLVYRARHTVALRSEYAHNGRPEQAGATYDEVRSLLAEARAVERA